MKKKLRRYIAAFLALIMASAVCISEDVFAAGGGAVEEPGIVSINGVSQRFTKDNPLIMLEIVPNLSMGEFGYYVAGSEPVPLDELDVWVTSGGWSGYGPDYYTLSSFYFSNHILEWDNTSKTVSNTDMFISAVWGANTVESEGVRVITMTPEQVNENFAEAKASGTESIVEQASLIYINPGHTAGSETVYKNHYTGDFSQTSFSASNDLSAEVTWEIFYSAKAEGKAFIGDSKLFNVDASANIRKLVYLMISMDYTYFEIIYGNYINPSDYTTEAYESLVNEMISNEDNFFTANASDKLVFYGKTNSHPVYAASGISSWTNVQMFLPYAGKRDKNSIYDILTSHPEMAARFNEFLMDLGAIMNWNTLFEYSQTYFNGSTFLIQEIYYSFLGCASWNGYYLRGNVWITNGDNALTTDLNYGAGSTTWSYNNLYIGYIEGYGPVRLDFYDIMEFQKASVSTNGKVINYILGTAEIDSKAEITKGFKVLEIEPFGSYSYMNYQGALTIAEYLGAATRNITENNYKDYVDVDGVTATQLNGMKADVVSEYDIIIFGGNASLFNEETAEVLLENPNIYYNNGELENRLYTTGDKLGNTTLSGNDLTYTMAAVLEEAAASGIPIILADKVYNLSCMQEGSNIRNLISGIRGEENVFTVSELTEEAEEAYYQYNLRMLHSAIASMTATDLNFSVSDRTVNISLSGAASRDYNLLIQADTTGNGSYNASVTTQVSTDAEGKADTVVNLGGITDEMLTNCDYMQIKVSAAYNGSITTLYAAKTQDGWSTDDRDHENDSRTFEAVNLRKTVMGYSRRTLEENTTRILQIIPDSGNGFVDLSADAVFQQLAGQENVINLYQFQVDTIQASKLEQRSSSLSGYSMFIVSAPLTEDQFDTLKNMAATGTDTEKPLVFTYYGVNSEIPASMKEMLSLTGYSDSTIYVRAKSGGYTWKNGSQPYVGAASGSLILKTQAAAKLNDGQIAHYPFEIAADTLAVSEVDAPYWLLDLNQELTVWYTLGDGSMNTKNYFSYSGQNPDNGYYVYSSGNAHYTLFGSSTANEEETKLFINLLILAMERVEKELPLIQVNQSYDLD